ncbi:hypothetical protein [Pleomorphomonas sp. PLEO]|uniref:hypothetical protein n=1 Tax=Pleomorphomonas sp. PLEO TaxID=3239306 RepID=UPI00351DEA6B
MSTANGCFDVPDYVIKRLRQFQALCRISGLAVPLGWVMGRQPERAAARSVCDPQLLRQTLDHREAGPLMLVLQRSVFQYLAARLPSTVVGTMAFADLPPLPFKRVSAPTLVIHGDADRVVRSPMGRGRPRRSPAPSCSQCPAASTLASSSI